MLNKKITLIIIGLLLPLMSFAHVATSALTWQYGVLHPLTGFDHFLTMFGIGLLSYFGSETKTVLFKMPLIFCAFLTLAFVLQTGSALELSKFTPAVLIVVLGVLMIKADKRLLVWAVLPLIALTHGHIHAHDGMFIFTNYAFISGFVLSTFVLHVAGIKVAEALHKFYKSSNRLAGCLMMAIGSYLFVAA